MLAICVRVPFILLVRISYTICIIEQGEERHVGVAKLASVVPNGDLVREADFEYIFVGKYEELNVNL